MTQVATGTQATIQHDVINLRYSTRLNWTLSSLHQRMRELEDLLDIVLEVPRGAPAGVYERGLEDPVYSIISLNYNSPLEIVLYITGGASSAAFAGIRVLAFWDAWNASRVKRSEADLSVAQNQLREEALAFLAQQFSHAATHKQKKAVNAARALSGIDEIKMLE